MAKAPAFLFYGADFLQGTSRFTLEERGAFVVLLINSWEAGPLPLDLGDLARMCGMSPAKFRSLWDRVLAEKWERTDAGYINHKLESVRASRQAFAAKGAKGGAISAAHRRAWRDSDLAADGQAAPQAKAQAERQATRQAKVEAKQVADGQAGANIPISDLQTLPGIERQEGERPPAPADLRDAWNALTAPPLPRCTGLSTTRKVRAQARLREEPSLDAWSAVIRRIAASPFCQGANDRGWVADFDFLLQPDTRLKVLEGKYDDRPRGAKPAPSLVGGAGLAIAGVAPDVQDLCELAGLPRHVIGQWFPGVTLTDDPDVGMVMVVPDAEIEAWIRRHYFARLEAAFAERGRVLKLGRAA